MQEREYFKGNFVQILVINTVVGIVEYFGSVFIYVCSLKIVFCINKRTSKSF